MFSWRRKAQAPRGVGGHAPQGIFKIEYLRNAISSVSGTKETVS